MMGEHPIAAPIIVGFVLMVDAFGALIVHDPVDFVVAFAGAIGMLAVAAHSQVARRTGR